MYNLYFLCNTVSAIFYIPCASYWYGESDVLQDSTIPHGGKQHGIPKPETLQRPPPAQHGTRVKRTGAFAGPFCSFHVRLGKTSSYRPYPTPSLLYMLPKTEVCREIALVTVAALVIMFSYVILLRVRGYL